MNKTAFFALLFLLISNIITAQAIDNPFSQKKMRKDLQVFKEIREQANSGLYKYRTEAEIDSIYNWAEKEVETASTYLDFYNILCELTDYEGSLHNDTDLPESYSQSLRDETQGYFPYPVKWIDGKWLINFENGEIPLGSELREINGEPISEVMVHLYKYYTTDGQNTSGKRIGIQTHFAKYYRWHYGQKTDFKVTFKNENSDLNETKTLQSIGYIDYYRNFMARYSKPFDQIYYADLEDNQKYSYEKINSDTGVLTIHTFAMGNETTKEHQTYVAFLERTFANIKEENLQNLIVDVRQNGGGTDPNDLVTYSYLTQRNFQENKQAWISFKKIPFLNYYDINVPRFLRPFGVRKYNKEFQDDFPLEKSNGYYQIDTSDDHQIRTPNNNAFTGNIYLLISPAVASAGSLFAAMVAGNANTITIGEETMGGYYGHNGHSSLDYKLPKSKIEFSFSVVNLEQDVPTKENQAYNRGIMPDHIVHQSFKDYLAQKDTQLNFTLELIKKNTVE